MVVVGARKLGHISCGNGVITSPITRAIRVGGLPKSGNKAYRHTDGHSWEGIKNGFRRITHKNMFISWAKTTRWLYLFTDVTGNFFRHAEGYFGSLMRRLLAIQSCDSFAQIYCDMWFKQDDGWSCGADLIVWTVKMLLGWSSPC